MDNGMEKLKVMHVLNTGGYSGAEHIVIDLICGNRDQCQCVYVSRKGKIQEILKKEGIEHHAIKRMTFYEIRRQIHRIRPDVIHAHDFTAGIVCSAFAKAVPVIHHLHQNSPWMKGKNIKSMAYRLSAQKASCILAVSESVMKEYVFGREFLKKTKVMGNPFDASKIRALAKKGEWKEGCDLLFCGRLSVPKNPLLFLDIVLEVKKKIPDIKAVMIGDGELKHCVMEKIKNENLQHTIQMLGFMENPYGVMKNCRVLCMPSLWEGFGLAALEAMALGKPVIASAVGGLTHFVDESCGALCEGQSEFADRISKLLLSPDIYEKKSKGAMARSEKMDNATEYVDAIVGLYNEVLKDRGKCVAEER